MGHILVTSIINLGNINKIYVYIVELGDILIHYCYCDMHIMSQMNMVSIMIYQKYHEYINEESV